MKLLIKSVLTSQLPLESVNYNEISYSNQHLAHETGESQQTVLLSLPIFLRSGDQISKCPQEGIEMTSLCCNGFSTHSAHLWCILGLEITFLRDLLRSEPI